MIIITGTSNRTYDPSVAWFDFRIERAHQLCVEALKTCPSGQIPVQTVYEMLLTLIDREDVIKAQHKDGEFGQ